MSDTENDMFFLKAWLSLRLMIFQENLGVTVLKLLTERSEVQQRGSDTALPHYCLWSSCVFQTAYIYWCEFCQLTIFASNLRILLVFLLVYSL